MQVVFLDVDGVLNTRTTCEVSPSGLYHGVDPLRVSILAKAMAREDIAGVVLTSTWKTLGEDDEDFIYLTESLTRQRIKILGKTEDAFLEGRQREKGIIRYLEENPEIEDFIILDDQHYGFDNESKLWERYIDTEGHGIENAKAASNTPTILSTLFLDAVKEVS